MKHAVLQKEGQGGLRSMCEQITYTFKHVKDDGKFNGYDKVFLRYINNYKMVKI